MSGLAFEATIILALAAAGADHISVNGHRFSILGLKFKLFRTKGVICSSCGIKGKYFVIFRDESAGTYYMNLYTECGILITKDHIHPKSRGGKTTMSNLQPMCVKCNMKKGNSVHKK